MSIAGLAIVLALASFAVLSAAATVLARRAAIGRHATAASQARMLFLRAVGPTAGAAIVSGLVLTPSFLMHELPRDEEWPGVLLLTLAALGAARLATISIRGIEAVRASRTLVRTWLPGAVPLPLEPWGVRASRIDAGFPVVAVAGLFTARVFVDRRVLEACSPEELAAVAAHERAHAASRDNLRRLLVAACAGHNSNAACAWRVAAERSADERAASSPRVAADLAAALVRVARTAPMPSLPLAAISTIHDGGTLEVRVRRLLACAPVEQEPRTRRWPILAGASVAVAGLMLTTPLPLVLHGVLELLVQRLP